MRRVPCGSACVLRPWFNSAASVYALECPPSAGGAGRVPDVESIPGEPSAGNSTSQGLVHPKTHPLPAPHSVAFVPGSKAQAFSSVYRMSPSLPGSWNLRLRR